MPITKAQVEALPTYHPEVVEGRGVMERADNAYWVDKDAVLALLDAAGAPPEVPKHPISTREVAERISRGLLYESHAPEDWSAERWQGFTAEVQSVLDGAAIAPTAGAPAVSEAMVDAAMEYDKKTRGYPTGWTSVRRWSEKATAEGRRFYHGLLTAALSASRGGAK